MTESSPNFNVDYVRETTTKRVGNFLRNIVRFLPETPLAPSEYPKHPERRTQD